MAVIKSFRAIRPIPEYASQVAALPYDVMSSEEARVAVVNNPHSFLFVDKAEVSLSPDVDIYSDEVYAQARANLDTLVDKGILIQDEENCLYIYQLEMDGRVQTGLVACTSIDEYLNGKIKKHELTREDKEQDRIRHVDTCDAHTGPIFLTYREKAELTEAIEAWKKTNKPVYDFKAADGISHTVWVIDNAYSAARIIALFGEVPSLYIADGHHRNASAVKVGLARRKANPEYTGQEGFNYCMSVLFPSSQLHVMDYNRVVKDLNGLTVQEFIAKVSAFCHVEPWAGKAFAPRTPHEFGMYVDHIWYRLVPREGVLKSKNPIDQLDVSILQRVILDPILGIGDPRTDKRINFVGGIRGLRELERMVNSGDWAVAFSMFPTSIDEVMNIADEGLIMPPKSTWFEPKLRSGLFVHRLSEE